MSPPNTNQNTDQDEGWGAHNLDALPPNVQDDAPGPPALTIIYALIAAAGLLTAVWAWFEANPLVAISLALAATFLMALTTAIGVLSDIRADIRTHLQLFTKK